MSFCQKNMSLCLKQQYLSLCQKQYVSMSKTTISVFLSKNNMSLCQKQKHVFMSKSPYPPAFTKFFKENCKKIWRNKIKCVPLHPQMRNALVAQLVEHLTLNQGVQSSSLCRRTS